MNNRLPKQSVLRGKRSYSEVFSKGSFLNSSYINVAYLDRNDFQIGFAVSRRIKGAVKRNRFKRQLREIYRTSKSNFPTQKWIILIGKKEADSFEKLYQDVMKIIQQIN